MPYTIEEIKEKVTPIAIQYGVDKVGLFGSYARGEANEGSDLDFVIDKGMMRGLLAYCGMVTDLENVFSCHVDMVVRSGVSGDDFWEEVGRDEVVLYAG